MTPESQLLNFLPAVAIGGPPHSGKSVLAYTLTQALRAHAVPHYLLRAYPPDGEGDWTFVPAQAAVRPFRRKGTVNAAWLARLRRDLANRRLPFLVDLGGLPTPEQETLLDECTHSLLLAPDDASTADWRDRFARHGLVPLAELRSVLHAQEILVEEGHMVRGIIGGLERGQQAQGVVTQRLVTLLEQLFAPYTVGLRDAHLRSAPVDWVLDLEALAGSYGFAPTAWDPTRLPDVLDDLPAGAPLALYGRAPNWIYAALAHLALPAPCYTFDPRRGWVEVPTLHAGALDESWPWRCEPFPAPPDGSAWRITIPETYLDLDELPTAQAEGGRRVPLPPPTTVGLVLSGKLPQWLWAALTRACRAAWIAVHQPQEQAAIVVTRGGAARPGERLNGPWLQT